MTTQTKRPTIKVGDIAYVPSAGGFGATPLYRITKVELDEAGEVSHYHLSELGYSGPGRRVEARRVAGVFSNILNPQE